MMDPSAGGLIRTFPRVVRLEFEITEYLNWSKTPLALFHNFSPVLKSLHLNIDFLPRTQIFDLICSFPLPEDLDLLARDGWRDGGDPYGPRAVVSSAWMPLSGSLDLRVLCRRGMSYAARQLLALPGGLHFRKLTLSWLVMEELRWIMELVERCSDSLECFVVKCCPPCTSTLVLR